MQKIKQQVLNLIHDYQAAVYHAVTLLNAKSEQEKGFQMRDENTGVRAGYLDSARQVKYSFHGTGCMIISPAFTVDFDYAQEGGCTGIDIGFMVDFLKRNPTTQAKYPLLISEGQVEQIMQELAEEGVLTKYLYNEYDRRYYLTANIGNQNQPTVTLYMPDEDVSK